MTFNRSLRIVLLLLCAACHPDKSRKVDPEELKFTTTDASELFFKNVRKSDYVTEDLPAAGMQVYRNERQHDERPLVSLALVVNWKTDQAFLIFEKADTLADQLIFLLKNGSQTDTLYFDTSNQRNHATVALQLYNALLDKQDVLLLHNAKAHRLFSDAGQLAFRRMVFDFLRLVELR